MEGDISLPGPHEMVGAKGFGESDKGYIRTLIQVPSSREETRIRNWNDKQKTR